MVSLLLVGLGKIALVFALGFGIAYPLSQINSTVTKNTNTQQQVIKQPKVESESLESKKCEVFLTSVDEFYKVVSCPDPKNTNNWYLFNSKHNTLTSIKGLTSSNSPKTKLGDSIDDWKEKEWRGLKGWNYIRRRGQDSIEDSFKIAYKEGSFQFPFFKYFQNICVAVNTYIRTGNKIEFSCDTLDFPSYRFENRWLIPEYKKAFRSYGKSICLEGKGNNWKTISCEQVKTATI